MNFQVANEIADQINRGENGGQYQILVQMCIPYLLRVRDHYRFWRVPDKIVISELASAAVSDSLARQKQLGRPFMVWLQNVFRDHCRRVDRDIRQEKLRQAIEACEIPYPPRTIGAYRENPPDEVAAQNEAWEIIDRALSKHEEDSRTAVSERMRGSPYEEIATILNRTAQQCRAVYQHDIRSIRDSIGHYFVAPGDQ